MHVSSHSTASKSKPFARVALPVPLTTTFTYEIPADLQAGVFVGARVEVPFGRRVLSGIVTDLMDSTDVKKTRPIRRVYDTYLTDELLELTKWIAGYYGCSMGEAAQSVLPPLLRKAARKAPMRGTVRLPAGQGGIGELARLLRRAPKQLELATALAQSGGHAGVETVVGEWGFTTQQVRSLIDRGVAIVEPLGDTSPLGAIDSEVVRLNADQQTALERMLKAIAAGRFTAMLLHGVTGSGKTELYLRAAHNALSQGGGCIVLVPEIGLLPQATARYRRVFGENIAILHSRLTAGERFEIWKRIETGECRLVLGPRSAVFSPVRNLRLIVVDEEQDDSYKQDDKPRYHARNIALVRGKNEKLTVVLGSATPSAESYHHASNGKYERLVLPERVGGTSLPAIQIVDLRESEMEGSHFSAQLLERLEYNVRKGYQSILFLNKRGHARFIQCNACGHVERCNSCDISLIYHRVASRMKCHFCGYDAPAVKRCRKCGSARLYFSGAGTQRIELDLSGFFPGVGILRMDADTTSGKEGHRRVLEKFSTDKYAILIGTQMVTKGHHFPRVNLVGVLHAESSLNYPDFRSGERTFQQLTQVAGRAGRSGTDGEVVVQTFLPDHHVFEFLVSHDYDGFMAEELRIRKKLSYPPFARIVLAACSAPNEALLRRVAEAWTESMRRELAGKPAEVFGPVPPLVARIKNRYREHVMIKGRLSAALKTRLLGLFQQTTERIRGGSSVELRWDVDPEYFG
jgi:primosomal protein N' (replication factor Y)